MNIFNICGVNIFLFLIFSLIFDQTYKICTKNSKSDGALTVILEFLAGVFILLLIPFFEIKFPTDIKIYILWGISIIFFAITDRINTTVRRGVEASTFNILRQISTVFILIAGILIFKEEVVFKKIIGAILIIFSNILIFYEKDVFKNNKFVLLGIIANITYTVAILLEIDLANYFNLPMFIGINLMVPAILIYIFNRVKIKDIKEEFSCHNKGLLCINSLTWGLSIFAQIRAYNIGNMTIVAPLCATAVILNVIAGYLFLKERDNLLKKIIAGAIIVFSVFLIK